MLRKLLGVVLMWLSRQRHVRPHSAVLAYSQMVRSHFRELSIASFGPLYPRVFNAPLSRVLLLLTLDTDGVWRRKEHTHNSKKEKCDTFCPSECLAVWGSPLYKASFFHNGKFLKENNEDKGGRGGGERFICYNKNCLKHFNYDRIFNE